MRYFRPFVLVSSSLFVSGVLAQLAPQNGARQNGGARTASIAAPSALAAPALAGPAVAGRASGPKVPGYTLVDGISVGGSVECAAPGQSVDFTASLSGSGSTQVPITFKARRASPPSVTEIGSCSAMPNQGCEISYTLPAYPVTITASAPANSQNAGAGTVTSNPFHINLGQGQWGAEPELGRR